MSDEPWNLVCVGNITIDDAVLPDGTRQNACLGGDALYAALAARLFEPRVTMVAPIGTGLPDAAAAAMAAAGFPVDEQPQRQVPTIRNVVTYQADGTRSWDLLTGGDGFDALSVYPDDISGALLGARAYMVAAMSLRSQATLTPWLRSATDATVYLDLQEDYILGNEDEVLALIGHAHVFLPSEEEVRRLLGTEDWEAAARRFAKLGPDVVVIKRGAAGSLVYEAGADAVVEVAPRPTDVRDATGAGDAFCGAFSAVHQQTGDPVRAARAGTIAASVTIRGYGTSELMKASPRAAQRDLEAWC